MLIAIFSPLVYTKVEPLLFLYAGETVFCLVFIVLRSQHKGLVKFPLWVEVAYGDILYVHLFTCCQSCLGRMEIQYF